IGYVFAVLAIPALLRGRFLTVGWAAEAGMLLLFAEQTGTRAARRWGLAALALALIRLVFVEAWLSPSPGVLAPFTERGFAFMAVIAALAIATGIALVARDRRQSCGRVGV